ncbi:MAG: adenylate/guanylate cyclase domain-containing protein [Gammaproteobacteria bacterium]|nr:adenylate/guanylate cyclase domain-containing protein [Gammaproteobacteria bacterium]
MAERVKRRLAAIIAADVVGYSRLMRLDEEATMAAWWSYRQDVIDPTVAGLGGRVVKLTGDGFLAEFASATDAVSAAIAMQAEIASRIADVPEEKRVRFRMGINLGDILWDDEDIYGDGVNTAARIEALAEPGGILVSASVHDQVRHRVSVGFEDMGEHQLKNIDVPLRIYRVSSDPSASTASVPKADIATLPNRPSIAVLPFAVIGGNRSHADFADGLGADINTELSRSGTIVVVGHQVSKRHSLETESIKDIGRTLAVAYLLSGSVRIAGNRVRISAEMLEIKSGYPQWSERYDRSIDDLFALQEDISRKIVGMVEPTLHRSEMDRISRSPPSDLQPNELMLRAWRTSDEGNEEGNRTAQRDLEEAIRRDPQYSDAHTQLAWIYWYDAMNGWTNEPEKTLHKALECAEKGLSLNPKDYDALGGRGAALVGLGKYEAITRIIEALEKKFPGHAHATMYRAQLLNSLGQHQEALELMRYSMEINPEHDHWQWMQIGLCHFCLERFVDAVDAFEQFKAMSKFPRGRLFLAAAYAAAGRKKDARTEIDSLGADVDILTECSTNFSYRVPDDRERIRVWAQKAAQPK